MTTSYSVSSNLYVNIGDLEPGRTAHGLMVRVIRCYRKPSVHKADQDGSLEMIVHDERGSHTCHYGLFCIQEKKIEIKEGGLYKIMTFMVAQDMSQYKTTNNPLKLIAQNKSQGQSLANVGLYLKKPVFNHGQLYVAVSRVTNPTGLKILLCPDEDDETNSTVNVVYKEVFQNL
ncbi:hypothetical protein CASFOL_035638 [Castilleja foliolosa]|uniref:Replication protein A 70 kDa DNA-binding subunit B/D first OB fold domain-containing protein n=1 Tax=Castilleja foliolosa TaxID=1961234 RepID=A0ABD3BUS0_9LAMI